MTRPQEHRIEVWNSANTTKLGIIPLHLITADSFFTEELNGDYSCDIGVDISYDGISNLISRNIIRVVNAESSLFSKENRTFRIQSVKKDLDVNGTYIYRIFSEHLSFDLLSEVVPDTTTYCCLTVTQLLTKILTGSSFTVGTIDRNVNIPEFTVGGKNRLDNIKELIADQQKIWLWINDSKQINFINYDMATIDARFNLSARNLLDTQYETDTRRLVTRMFGIGGGDPKMTLSQTWHPIESLVIAGGSASATVRAFKIAHSNNSWTDISTGTLAGRKYYLVFRNGWKPTTYYYHITAFTAQKDGFGTSDEIVVARDSNPIWSAGIADVAIYYSDDSGVTFTAVNYIEDRESYLTYGVIDGITEDSSLEFTENLAVDPFLFRKTYTSGKHELVNNTVAILCQGTGPVFAENTDIAFIRNGTKSQKITAGLYGEGAFIDVSVFQKSNDSIYFSVKMLVYIVSGKVRFDVQEKGPYSTGARPQEGVFPPFATNRPIFTASTGKFVEVVFNGVKNEGTTSTDGKLRIFCYQHESAPATAVWYLDSIQVEPLQAASELWFEGSTKKILWDKSYDELGKVRKPFKTYNVKVRDLFAETTVLYGADQQFEVTSTILLYNEILGINDTLVCTRKKVMITNPSDIEVQLDTIAENTFSRDAELYFQVKKQSDNNGRAINNIMTSKYLLDGNRKTASIQDLSVQRNQPLTVIDDVQSGDAYAAKIVWAGHVHHGCQFLQKLVVPAGRKVVFSFCITESGESTHTSFTVSGNRHFDVADNIIALNLPDELSGPRIMNDSAFLLEDNTDTNQAIRFIKICIIPGKHPITSEEYDGGSPTYDRSTAFHSWIPPGTYTDLTMVALGKATLGTQEIMYGGPLILFEVPLRKAYVGAVDIAVGNDGFNIEASAVGGTGYYISESGRVKIGAGPNEEIVTLRECRNAPGNGFNTTFRGLLAGETFRYAHLIGEPVEEYQEGVTTGFTFQARPITLAFDVVHPTSITP